MSANIFMKEATRNICQKGNINRGWKCQGGYCRSWGMKKGLRRARRRVDKIIIERELVEI